MRCLNSAVTSILVLMSIVAVSPAAAQQAQQTTEAEQQENKIVCYAYTYSRSLVRSVQEKLQVWGYDPGPVDGFWGPQTEEALLKFQGHFEIGTSGQLDEPTLRTMFGQPLPEGVTVERNPDKLSEAEFAAQCE